MRDSESRMQSKGLTPKEIGMVSLKKMHQTNREKKYE